MLFRLIVIGILSALAALAQAQTQTATPALNKPRLMVLPPARITTQTPEMQAIVLQEVSMQTQIFANHARTIVTLVLKNPNPRQLEGNFEFPLFPEQHVSGFALDINGKLRAASSVPKARAQEIFEDIRRIQVDPGLLEKNAGNVYRMRIYPIPANGTRTAQLTIDQLLPNVDDKTLELRVPLGFSTSIGQFKLNVATPSTDSITITRGLPDVKIGTFGLEFSAQNFNAKEWLALRIAQQPSDQWQVQTHHNQQYVLARLPIHAQGVNLVAPRPAPQNIDLFWDASTSSNQVQTARALAALDAYFRHLLDTKNSPKITLHWVRNRVETLAAITLTRDNLGGFLNTLQTAANDGATRLDQLTPSANSDLVILVSDGLATFGAPKIQVAGNAPIYTLNTGISSHIQALTQLADSRQGQSIDLTRGSSAEAVQNAVRALTEKRAFIQRISSASLSDLVTPQRTLVDASVMFAARMHERQGDIEVDVVDALGKNHRLRFAIPAIESSGTMAAQQWAQWQVNASLATLDTQRKTIEQLSKDFALVSDTSSLLVLETAQDYARYDVAPPEELAKEVANMKRQSMQQQQADKAAHLAKVVREFSEKEVWWNKDFPKKSSPHKPKNSSEDGDVTYMQASPHVAVASPAPSMALERRSAPTADTGLREKAETLAAEPLARKVSANNGATPNQSASIQLQKWQANAPYVARFKAAKDADLYAIYLDERGQYTTSTAFYLDVADIFLARQQTELGLRILSNLAEMNLDNRHVLRILSYRLIQAKQATEAIPFLQRVTELAPNEPQSWRDLGLAYAATGAYQMAIENLWKVVTEPWHNRFPGIEQIALNELNAIAANYKKQVNTDFIDARLQKNLPVDLRVVLGWDADDTDIDLWVTDPNGEKVYYGHRLSHQGGRISNDFTGGYGPEEFLLKSAKPGVYKVEAQFYGHRQQIVAPATSLMMRLTTQFGRRNQRDENVILRLSGNSEVVFVGEFTVK